MYANKLPTVCKLLPRTDMFLCNHCHMKRQGRANQFATNRSGGDQEMFHIRFRCFTPKSPIMQPLVAFWNQFEGKQK